MDNGIEVYNLQKFLNCNFEKMFLNWIISVIYGSKFIKSGRHPVGSHSVGTVI